MQVIYQANLSRERRAIKSFMAAGLLIGILILFFVPPAKLPVPVCAFHSVTGHSCMTCGLTRSLHAISHGEFAASVRYHLFGPALFIAMLLCFVVFTTEAVSGKASAIRVGSKMRNQALLIFAIVWFVYWCTRLFLES